MELQLGICMVIFFVFLLVSFTEFVFCVCFCVCLGIPSFYIKGKAFGGGHLFHVFPFMFSDIPEALKGP